MPETDTLEERDSIMMGLALRLGAKVIVGIGLAGAAGMSASAADRWEMQTGRLGFTATQLGAEFQGEFARYRTDIVFAQDNLDNSRVTVEIDMNSVTTNSADRDQAIVTADWFAVGQFPTAVFTTRRFSRLGEGRYRAQADLTIRDVTETVVMDFSLEVDGDLAKVTGAVDLSRTAFGVGQGQFSDTTQIGDEVIVEISLTARRTNPAVKAGS